MENSIKVFTIILCMLVYSFPLIAQNSSDSTDNSLMISKWLSKGFIFNKPDTGFYELPDGNGYSNVQVGASIKLITFPSQYLEVKNEFLEQKSTETSIILDTIYAQLNHQETFCLVREEISPDKTKYENYISIMFVAGFGDITVCIVGAYPISSDRLLRNKYIQAFLTLKELKN